MTADVPTITSPDETHLAGFIRFFAANGHDAALATSMFRKMLAGAHSPGVVGVVAEGSDGDIIGFASASVCLGGIADGNAVVDDSTLRIDVVDGYTHDRFPDLDLAVALFEGIAAVARKRGFAQIVASADQMTATALGENWTVATSWRWTGADDFLVTQFPMAFLPAEDDGHVVVQVFRDVHGTGFDIPDTLADITS
ncbi:hypothetical protein [Leifsonia sp. Leaf264]|uniref:hypothetical protein n=1 Tax=Leifsonia sp. Leaf264 TaxID=1736314 RepID=UPI0006F3A965|nr:hypothetical protein [Leifsonia sp. Leaf264]KQO98547.1 hypothetical protein ASF30_10825 [Leifsonia sp. Leaf264]